MIWYDPLFVGAGCQSQFKSLRRRIAHRAVHRGVYLITLPTQEGMVLEIIPSALLQEHYPEKDLRIIGMASTRGEALSLVEQIIRDTFLVHGDTDVEAYLRSFGDHRWKETT